MCDRQPTFSPGELLVDVGFGISRGGTRRGHLRLSSKAAALSLCRFCLPCAPLGAWQSAAIGRTGHSHSGESHGQSDAHR